MTAKSRSNTGKAPPADPEGRPMADVVRAARIVGRQRQAADVRAARLEENPPPAPLPTWMNGDRAALPKRPPGKS